MNPTVKKYLLDSPWTQENVKWLVRGSYGALSSSLIASERCSDQILMKIIKLIKEELKHICSLNHSSILRDDNEAVKRFSWETVWLELQSNVPILMKILTELLPTPNEDKPLICLIVSMILKKRLSKMGLVQRALSILLYGNGTSRQVIIT